jgi:hypothetical protein
VINWVLSLETLIWLSYSSVGWFRKKRFLYCVSSLLDWLRTSLFVKDIDCNLDYYELKGSIVKPKLMFLLSIARFNLIDNALVYTNFLDYLAYRVVRNVFA